VTADPPARGNLGPDDTSETRYRGQPVPGAKDWTRDKRVAYANYLGDPRHLEAVSQRSNRQKADQDVTPPPDTGRQQAAAYLPAQGAAEA
jgi:hypothetical protein